MADSPTVETTDLSGSHSSLEVSAPVSMSSMRKRNTRIDPAQTFEHDDPKIRDDIVKMIVQYLESAGYTASAAVLQDESNVKMRLKQVKQKHANRMRKIIIDGEWETVEELTKKVLKPRTQPGFLYAVYKQEYLELIDAQQTDQAFAYLNARLKPLENLSNASGRGEFADLCYLLTCKSVRDARSFASWEGATASRSRLADTFQMAYIHERADTKARKFADEQLLPENRLLSMLQQAVAYQMEFGRYHRHVAPKAHTLLTDYRCFTVPNAVHSTFSGHSANVKCVEFVGAQGVFLASGGSDNTVRIWRTDRSARLLDHEGMEARTTTAAGSNDTGGDSEHEHPPDADAVGDSGSNAAHGYDVRECECVLRGHTSRVWDLSSHHSGRIMLSASGDSTVKLWDTSSLDHSVDGNAPELAPTCAATIAAHEGDVYTVQHHPHGNYAVTGSYDRMVKLFDLRTQQLTKTFEGHDASVSSVIFNPHGNLVISGSKDKTIKFWDIVSGVCIKTFSELLGAVTSVQMNSSGILLLSSSKNNCNRLWDIRIGRPLAKRFKGHQNTSKNFVRAAFGPNERLIVGGSEDGHVYMWDAETCTFLQRLSGHSNVVYNTIWNNSQSLLASCSHDGTVKTWHYRAKS